MNSDCYAILGVSPSAEDAAIRAAYLDLMRRYHPDRNPSADAAGRAQAITQAYKVLSHPVSRAEYDALRVAHPLGTFGFASAKEVLSRRSWTNVAIGGAAASALALVLAVTAIPLIQREQRVAPWVNPDRQAAPRVQPARPIAAPAESPASAELPPAAPVPPVEADLPAAPKMEPPEAAAPARTEPVRAIKEPTAKVDKAPPRQTPVRMVAATSTSQPLGPKTATSTSRPPEPKAATSNSRAPAPKAAPSGNDVKLARLAKLAEIERHSTLYYNQSLVRADAAKRANLAQARRRFLATRNACGYYSCFADANHGHVRDIAKIMGAREQPAD